MLQWVLPDLVVFCHRGMWGRGGLAPRDVRAQIFDTKYASDDALYTTPLRAS